MEQDESGALISLDEARQRLGMPKRTFARRLAADELRVYAAPLDRRRRLVPMEDVERLTEPLEVRERAAGAAVK